MKCFAGKGLRDDGVGTRPGKGRLGEEIFPARKHGKGDARRHVLNSFHKVFALRAAFVEQNGIYCDRGNPPTGGSDVPFVKDKIAVWQRRP